MKWHSSNPWRCWERLTMAGALNGPDDLLVRVALFDLNSKIYQSEFRWPALVRLGPNDYRGRYAQVTLRFGDLHWSFEIAGDGDRTVILVRPFDAQQCRHVQIRLETLYQKPNGGEIVTRERDVFARRGDSGWRVSTPSPSAHRTGSTIVAPLHRPFVATIQRDDECGRRLEQRTESEVKPLGPDAALSTEEKSLIAAVQSARREYLARFNYVPRELWWMYAAIPYGIGWNMIWSSDLGQPLEVCSRDWCVHGNYGDWVLFNWDTWLLAPAAADYDRELAHQILRPQFEVQTPEGLIPGIASPLGISADRGMPPDAAFGVYKTYLRTGDRSFIDEYYDSLKRYNAWWRRNRDGNGDGLLEWGSNPCKPAHPQWQAHTYWASRYETGMDNNPMWDDVRFNADTNTQEQSDVGLSALFSLDSLCLSHMARVLGRKEDEQRLAARAKLVGEAIESQLWCDDVGLWLNRDWNGAWNHRASPICFYPLFLPTANRSHVDRAIADHLSNPKRFGGKYVMPVSPRDDAAYPEQYYVRGRIWPAQTLLVHSALREARREREAATLARGCIETMKQEWVEEGHLHENYHAETADGDDTPESDPLYSFGMMFPIAAWNQLRDVRLDGTEVCTDLTALDGFLDSAGALRARIDPIESLPA